MHAKPFIKRVLATSLALSMMFSSFGVASAADGSSNKQAVVSESSSKDALSSSPAYQRDKAKDPKSMTAEEYKYILDYYNIDENVINYTAFRDKYVADDVDASCDVTVSAYEAYLKANHFEKMEPEAVDVSTLEREVYSDDEQIVDLKKYPTALKVGETGFVDFEITVSKDGYYYPSFDFYNMKSKNSDIKRALFVDGELQYSELTSFAFKRMWVNNPNSYDHKEDGTPKKDKNGYTKWHSDNQGNNLKPSQMEVHDFQRSYIFDGMGYYTDELAIYLTAGTHTLTLYSIAEETIIYAINLTHYDTKPSYKEYVAANKGKEDNAKKQMITIEAEDATLKSSQMLYPQQDQSSKAVRPYSAKLLLNNSIGGNSWRLIGDWIEWEFDVKQSGNYNIELLCKQNFTKGVYVSRRIMIDGVVPFEEVNEYGFSYDSTWYYDKIGNGKKPYDFYLEAGHHKLRMTVVLGDFGDIVRRVSDVTDDLNKIYREVICVTGISPDVWRDYSIKSNIPGIKNELKDAYAKIDTIIKDFRKLAGKGSDKEKALTTMRTQLKELIKDPEYFVKVVADYRANVRACGTWIADVIGQPLALDSIYIYSKDTKVKERSNNFFVKFIHELKRLFYSFIVNYNIVGDVSDPNDNSPELVLWVGTGRDQSNVIKSMISEDFTANEGINVTVMLVDIGTLLQATLAGQGPDIAIEVNYDLPVNYGLRDAVCDLSKFDDLDEVLERFDPSSYEAYQYGDSTYALPCAQTFLVMFYRMDILKELGIDPPETWEEVVTALTVMSQNKMDLGMLPSEEVFLMFLLQNGGEYYNEEGSKTLLNTEEAINSFSQYCKWYTDYGVDVSTSVEERFRTGQAPIIISNFGYYNNLQVSAPDINGLWGVTHVPGTEKVATEDIYDHQGNLLYKAGETYIDHTIASVGNACIIMSACKDKKSAWKFLKWWTAADTQVLYSHEMESINGPSAKVPTANLEAFQQIGYPIDFTEIINNQRKTIRGIRQVAGSYFTYRYINNAFYAVNADKDSSTPREELTDRITYIDDEIEYKRHELKLDK